MKKVICSDCGKRYDFDKDDFCPRCGVFNPPPKQLGVDNYGNVVRVDGINERNHTGSFVHKEAHREKAVRRIKGLDRDAIKAAKSISPVKRKSATMHPQVRYVLEKALAYIVSMAVLWYLFSLLFDDWMNIWIRW